MTSVTEARTYMEEADDDGNVIDDTRTYVSVVPPSKEAANVSRMRNRNLTGGSSSSPNPNHHHTDSDSTTQPSGPPRQESRRPKTKSRDKDRSSSKKTVTDAPVRPSAKSSKTLPNLHTSAARKSQEQSYYGISPTGPSPIITPAGPNSRPRAYTANQRPNSYYGSPSTSKPPPANARYYHHPHPALNLGTSFPPQVPYPPPSAPLYQSPFPPPPPQFAQPPVDILTTHDALAARFDPFHRPPSAMQRRAIEFGSDFDGHEDGGHLERRPSLTRRESSRQDADRLRMPPPPRRPSTMRPQSGSYFPPPALKRQSIGSVASLYDDESLDEDSTYSGISPPERYPHPARRPSIDSTIYDTGHGYAEVPGRVSRRNSHYGGRRQSTDRGFEDKFKDAMRYQEDVDGPTTNLTADTLRRITKTPSKGTKSAGSKAESGYGRAASRNSMDPDDMTIFVKGMGSLTIGGAQLDLKNGAEIAIRTNGSERNSRGGSDNASSAYPDDPRTTRFERPQARVRAGSRAGSHSRAFAPHAPPAPHPPHPFQPQVDYYGNAYMPMAHAPYSPYHYNA